MSISASGIGGNRQAGISLVELVMFIVIVSVGIAGILSVMNVTSGSSADPMVRKQAIAIAESMLEEIQAKDFANPSGPGAFTGAANQANRALFDDVGDYHDFSTTGIFAIDGTVAINGLEAYSVEVSVLNHAGLSAAGNAVPAVDARLIAVTVTGPASTSITLHAYRTNHAP